MKDKYAAQKRWRERNPWARYLTWARDRCKRASNELFKAYGDKGIQCRLSLADVKFMWYRDGAAQMTKPSIDREKADLDYTLDNCCFMELADNVAKMHRDKARAAADAQHDMENQGEVSFA